MKYLNQEYIVYISILGNALKIIYKLITQNTFIVFVVLYNLFIPKTILYVDDNLSKMKIRQKLGRSISKFNNQTLENKIRSGFIE